MCSKKCSNKNLPIKLWLERNLKGLSMVFLDGLKQIHKKIRFTLKTLYGLSCCG